MRVLANKEAQEQAENIEHKILIENLLKEADNEARQSNM